MMQTIWEMIAEYMEIQIHKDIHSKKGVSFENIMLEW
jgi:hypothetical protein